MKKQKRKLSDSDYIAFSIYILFLVAGGVLVILNHMILGLVIFIVGIMLINHLLKKRFGKDE